MPGFRYLDRNSHHPGGVDAGIRFMHPFTNFRNVTASRRRIIPTVAQKPQPNDIGDNASFLPCRRLAFSSGSI
jgi:hypothetical protein